MESNGTQGRIAVVVPSFNPDGRLPALVAALLESFRDVILVDDGSVRGTEFFRAAESLGAAVLRHGTNRGKGAALKTAFSHVLRERPEVCGVVTADGDGQHLPEDVRAVAAALREGGPGGGIVLGVRRFGGTAPWRSRIGNFSTRILFKALTGLDVSDTQTGLRGIPRALLGRLAELPGDRYEYEVKMLADARFHPRPPVQIPISTVYLDGNSSSHFRPLRDSVLVWRALFGSCRAATFCRFACSGFGAFLLDNAVFAGAIAALGRVAPQTAESARILAAICCARAVSSNFNYWYNCRFVFGGGISLESFARYWALVAAMGALSWGGTCALDAAADMDGAAVTLLKMTAETVLFLLSYAVQKSIVFGRRGGTTRPL